MLSLTFKRHLRNQSNTRPELLPSSLAPIPSLCYKSIVPSYITRPQTHSKPQWKETANDRPQS